MIVVDASALVDAFIGEIRVADRLAGEELHAPHLIDLEVASALRRLANNEIVEESTASLILHAMQRADLHRHSHRLLLDGIWDLRASVNPYEAAYVVLAAALGTTLVTTDPRLASVPHLPCRVEAI